MQGRGQDLSPSNSKVQVSPLNYWHPPLQDFHWHRNSQRKHLQMFTVHTQRNAWRYPRGKRDRDPWSHQKVTGKIEEEASHCTWCPSPTPQQSRPSLFFFIFFFLANFSSQTDPDSDVPLKAEVFKDLPHLKSPSVWEMMEDSLDSRP